MEAVDLRLEHVEHEPHYRWRQADVPPWEQRHVTVGRLADGRWYVDLIADAHQPLWLYRTRQEALAAAQQRMGELGESWVPVPPDPTAAAVPEARRRARERSGRV